MPNNLLQVTDLSVYYPLKRQKRWFYFKKDCFKVVDTVSLSIAEGESVALVGESGCGKSTLARAIIGLQSSVGSIWWNQKELNTLSSRAGRKARKSMQMIFQDPFSSLDPRMTLGSIVAEPLKSYIPHSSRQERLTQVKHIMFQVGLDPHMVNRYPHELSGGQCQRIAMARALIVKPKLLICDEPTTALDMIIQAQIIDLLKQIRKKENMSILLITHDFRALAGLCDQTIVMEQGRIVEQGKTAELLSQPQTDYSKALLASIPLLPTDRQGQYQ